MTAINEDIEKHLEENCTTHISLICLPLSYNNSYQNFLITLTVRRITFSYQIMYTNQKAFPYSWINKQTILKQLWYWSVHVLTRVSSTLPRYQHFFGLVTNDTLQKHEGTNSGDQQWLPLDTIKVVLNAPQYCRAVAFLICLSCSLHCLRLRKAKKEGQ